MRWRSLRQEKGPGPWNMAMDVALARGARSGEGALRIYGWSRPTLSFGRNQPVRERFRGRALDEMGLEAVRRPTGGRDVLHDREVTYALAAPLAGDMGPRELYRCVTGAVVEALRSLGAPVAVSRPSGRAPALTDGPCFHEPGPDEVEVDGRKLVGSAQVRIGGAVLQHGSIPLYPPAKSFPGIEFGGIALCEALGGPVGSERVVRALEEAMAEALPGTWRRGRLRESERKVAEALVPYYESPTWTWRR